MCSKSNNLRTARGPRLRRRHEPAYQRIRRNRLRPRSTLQTLRGTSTTWPAKVRRKRSKTHSPRRPLWAPGGARRAPCGFCSALSHRFGRPCGGSPAECLESVPGAASVSVDPLIGRSPFGHIRIHIRHIYIYIHMQCIVCIWNMYNRSMHV